MPSHADAQKRPLSTPWTLSAYEALPGGYLSNGIAFTGVLLLVFFVGRGIVGDTGSTPDDFRIAITQILMTTYAATAYAYLLMTARQTTTELVTGIETVPDPDDATERAGRYARGVLPLIGALSYLVLGVGITNLTTPAPDTAWNWQDWNYDVAWHRATTVLFVWWTSCFSYVVMVESARLSRLSKHIETLDLLDMQPYRPLVRQGLTNALLVLGMVSVISLLGVESRYWAAGLGLWVGFMVLGWIGLVLPLRGIRKSFRTAKADELAWCDARLRQARDALKAGSGEGISFADAVAYRETIENLRNWPLDHSTLLRFTLYLLIPLGSWLGGAFVERALDFILS